MGTSWTGCCISQQPLNICLVSPCCDFLLCVRFFLWPLVSVVPLFLCMQTWSYHWNQRGWQEFGPQRNEVRPPAETCLISPPWCHWYACYPQQPGYCWLPAANQGRPPTKREADIIHQMLWEKKKTPKNKSSIKYYLWSCHLIWGQRDDAFYPGRTDLLNAAASNQLNSLKNHNSVTHHQLQEEQKRKRKEMSRNTGVA